METRPSRKERTGIVASNKMQKTIIVKVTHRVKHSKYGKYIKKYSRLMAHDEKNECNPGDTVRIIETRPLGKNKCWRLVEILERAE